ncbi:MAG TPA: hypothetical protein VEF53_13930 [Patescibacteria group bacterium]|nr:hypothetical protein [Patescibacteria group bacterium]
MKKKLVTGAITVTFIILLITSFSLYQDTIQLKTRLGNNYIHVYNTASLNTNRLYKDLQAFSDIKQIRFNYYSFQFDNITTLIRQNYPTIYNLENHFIELYQNCIEISEAIEINDNNKATQLKNEIIENLEKGLKSLEVVQKNGGKLYGTTTYRDSVEWYENINKNRDKIINEIDQILKAE